MSVVEESHVTRFYDHRSIFITGGTGFVGKVLIEKLLRSCPNLAKIYLLLRPKHDVSVEDRLQNLQESSIFDTLKKVNPDSLQKLIPIAGDITCPNLGISKEDERLLFENVSIVIHSAATVKFDEVMSLSADINVGGVQRVLDLARNMKNICAIVHISTAYCNCDKKTIREIIYPLPFDPSIAMKTFSWLSETVLKKITPDLIGNKPNTYAYTKSLAEHLVESHKGSLPVCIVRPSIVTATAKEPVEGWVDNWQGASGVLIAHGKGLLGATLANDRVMIDWIPVDYLVNLIVTAAWELGTREPQELVLYNCCSSPLNPLTQRAIKEYSMEGYRLTPFSESLGQPCMYLTPHQHWSKIHNIFTVLLPSLLVDLLTFLRGRQPFMLKYYRKVQTAVRVTTFFRNNDWNFTSENLVRLRDLMAPADKQIFNFNVEDLNWREYIHNYIHGIRKFILKEDDSTLKSARRRLGRISMLFSCFRILSFFLFMGMSSRLIKGWVGGLLKRFLIP